MIITIEKCTHAYGRLFLLVALMAAFPLSDGSVHGIESSLALPTFWDSHMVLQREPMAANIWGWAAPGTNVSVSIHFGGRIVGVGKAASIFSITDGEGLWSVDIPPQRAGSGYAIHVSDGSKNIELEDVAFGDVYLCSGQSNMQMDVGSTFNASAEVSTRMQKHIDPHPFSSTIFLKLFFALVRLPTPSTIPASAWPRSTWSLPTPHRTTLPPKPTTPGRVPVPRPCREQDSVSTAPHATILVESSTSTWMETYLLD